MSEAYKPTDLKTVKAFLRWISHAKLPKCAAWERQYLSGYASFRKEKP